MAFRPSRRQICYRTRSGPERLARRSTRVAAIRSQRMPEPGQAGPGGGPDRPGRRVPRGNAAGRRLCTGWPRPTRLVRKTAPWSTAPLAGRGDPRRQRPRNRSGGGRLLPRPVHRQPARPGDARRGGHPAVRRTGPGVRRGQRLGARLRDQRRRLRQGGLGGNYGGTSTAGDYTVGFVTGSVGSYDWVDKLENTLRKCLGLGPDPWRFHELL